ncbi:MAG: (2Fe-2S) ferredoxin domain-containing protein [Gloeomargarita sp. HHBFW_bins_162]
MQILTGTFVGFLPSGKGKLKFIRIRDGEQEHQVKLPKYMRAGLMRELVVGMGVKVAVRWHDHSWEATDILLFSGVEPLVSAANLVQSMVATQPACRVEVCQKGSCRKQGSMQLLQELGEMVREQGWEEWVFVEGSGCQKACKQGPNVRINGQMHHRVEVATLMPRLAEQVERVRHQQVG